MHSTNWLRKSLLKNITRLVLFIPLCHPCRSSAQETIKYLPDAVEFSFLATQPLRADNQVTRPIDFSIILPPNPLAKYSFGIDAFGFRYDGKQIVYIYIDYISPGKKDTTYQIKNQLEIEELLVDKLSLINTSDQLDIENNPFIQERKTFLIRKGAASILLYNIFVNQSQRFVRSAQTFSFINLPVALHLHNF